MKKVQKCVETAQWDEALGLLTGLIGEKGEPAEAMLHRAYVAMRAGQTDRALDDALKGVELRPENGVFWMILGEVQLAQGRSQEAVASLRKAVSLEADNGRALYHLGAALRAHGQATEAADYFEQALQFERDYVLAQEMSRSSQK
jgi:Flp pilus assembly protein TadD